MASAKGWPAMTDVALNADTEHERTRPCGTKNGEDIAAFTFEAFVWNKSTNFPIADIVMFSKVAMPFKACANVFPRNGVTISLMIDTLTKRPFEWDAVLPIASTNAT